MKSDITLPPGVDPSPFYNELTKYLSYNLIIKLRTSVSNLLAIDYAGRLESEPPLDEHIDVCIGRLKKHLGPRIILNETFSSSMTLFTVAITPEKKVSDDNKQSQEQSQDALIDAVISSHFKDLSPQDREMIKEILRDVMNGKDGKELMNVIISDPKIFYSIVLNAAKAKKQQHEISEFVEMHLMRILSKTKQLDKKVGGIKNTIGKIALSAGLLVAASIGMV